LTRSPPCRVSVRRPGVTLLKAARWRRETREIDMKRGLMAAAVGRLGGVLPLWGCSQGRAVQGRAGRTRNQPRPLRARRRPSGIASSPRARRTSTGSPSTPARSAAAIGALWSPTRTFRPSSSTGRPDRLRTTARIRSILVENLHSRSIVIWGSSWRHSMTRPYRPGPGPPRRPAFRVSVIIRFRHRRIRTPTISF